MSKGKTSAAITAQVLTSSPTEQSTLPNQLPGHQFATLLEATHDSEHRLDRKLVDFRVDVQQAQDEVEKNVNHM